jgi:hypothetical protein
MDVYPKAAVEWAQEVILRAIKRKISEGQATEIIGISRRSIGRWRERYEEHPMTVCRRRVGRAANGCASGQVEQFGLFRSGLPNALFQIGCAQQEPCSILWLDLESAMVIPFREEYST